MNYHDLFERNYGVFTEEEQDRIRRTRILIVGDSGTGETLSVLLARCGFERFTLFGERTYTKGDMNRQIGCFLDTIGTPKIVQMEKMIRSINPAAEVSGSQHLPGEAQLDALVQDADLVIPAVEDLSYSILIFRCAKKHAKPALLCMPSGSMGWVSVFTKDTPTIEDVFGIPPLSYKGLRRMMHTREYRCAQYTFITSGDWRVPWFWDYFLDKRPLALICTTEWMAVSLAALEALKVATHTWNPTLAPKCWYLRRGRVSRSHFSLFVKYHRKLGWLIFGQGVGKAMHKLTHLFWGSFFRILRSWQTRKEQKSPDQP